MSMEEGTFCNCDLLVLGGLCSRRSLDYTMT
jgi:hypothetical protein